MRRHGTGGFSLDSLSRGSTERLGNSHHVGQRFANLLPATGLETAIGVDPKVGARDVSGKGETEYKTRKNDILLVNKQHYNKIKKLETYFNMASARSFIS